MIELKTDTFEFVVKWLRLLFSSLVPCHVSLLRLSRLLKWHSVETFFFLSDYKTSKPNRLRAFKLILYLSVAMHWVACIYYTISEYEGLGTNDWVYTETEKGGDRFIRSALNNNLYQYLLLTSRFRSVSQGPSFFPFDLWFKREEFGPWIEGWSKRWLGTCNKDREEGSKIFVCAWRIQQTI